MKHSLFGIGVDAVDYTQAVEEIAKAAQNSVPFAVSATAVHGLITAYWDADQRYRLNQFGLIVPDGQPLVWALNSLYGVGLKSRVYGPQLTLEVCAMAAATQLPCYFYGSKEGVLQRLVERLQRRFPGMIVAGSSPSLFRTTTVEEKQEICERIIASGAKLVFVGLGCPRQEVWAYEYAPCLAMPVIAVGAAFDFHAGCLPQAPAWMQVRGLEWLFRLAQEPRRLWRRYLSTNPTFLALWARQQLLGAKSFQKLGQPDPVPPQPILYG